MNIYLQTLLRAFRPLLALLAACSLAACARTVHWEEEVLLNTGETIWVQKQVRYSIKGQPGNPADLGYVPDWVETISFEYAGRKYSYSGEAGIMVLAISPTRQPRLLAAAHFKNWDRKAGFKCVAPYYVQFIPSNDGQQWTWPTQIEPWTYHLPINLMINRDDLLDVKQRYTMADKAKQQFLRDPDSFYLHKIDPNFTTIDCIKAN